MNEKRNDCLTARKTYWKILNRSSKNIKIPLIPPLLVNGETVPNFLQKAELFKKFFASQCCFFKNSSTLPPFNLQTDKVVDKFSFSEDDITQIIKKLNLNKQHGWDNISVRMIKVCDKSVSYPLKLVFQASFQE